MAPKQILPDTPAAALPAHCGWQQRRGVPGTWRLRTAWTPPSKESRIGRTFIEYDERTGQPWEWRERIVPSPEASDSSSTPASTPASPVDFAEPTFVFQTPGAQAGAAGASSGSSASGSAAQTFSSVPSPFSQQFMLSDAVKRAVAVLHSGRSSRRVRLATILVLFPNAAYRCHVVLVNSGAVSDLLHPSVATVWKSAQMAELTGPVMAKGLFQDAGAMGDPGFMDFSTGNGYVGRAYGCLLPSAIARQVNFSILSQRTSYMLGFHLDRLNDDTLRPPFDSDRSPYGVVRDSQGLQHLTAPKLYLRPSVLADLDSRRRNSRVRDEHYPIQWKNTYGNVVGDSHVVYRPGVDLRRTHPGFFQRTE